MGKKFKIFLLVLFLHFQCNKDFNIYGKIEVYVCNFHDDEYYKDAMSLSSTFLK